VEASLKKLVEMLTEGHEGYKELGARLQNAQVKHLFLEETQRRAEFAAELENELHRMGVHDVKVHPSRLSKARCAGERFRRVLQGARRPCFQRPKRETTPRRRLTPKRCVRNCRYPCARCWNGKWGTFDGYAAK
jgi:hypothetical protein